MISTKYKTAFLTFLVFICSQSLLFANNEAITKKLSEAIQEDNILTQTRKKDMCQIVSDALSEHPELDADKVNNAKDNLKCYFKDIVSGTKLHTDQQFEYIKEKFKWNLGNYARMVPIATEERNQARQTVLSLKGGVNDFIQTSYSDMPDKVKTLLFSAFEKELDQMMPQIGNYFYPAFLYPRETEISTEMVLNYLKNDILNNNNRKSRFNNMLNNEKLSEEHRESRMNFFAEEQARRILYATRSLSRKTFDISKALADNRYQLPPEELMQMGKKISKELYEQALQRQKEMMLKYQHQKFVGEILEGTGIQISDGMSYYSQPTEYLPDKNIQNSSFNKPFFIPNKKKASINNEPYIFDFTSNQLINIPTQDGISNETPSELNKGDIAWDGTILAMRNAILYNVDQKTQRPYKNKPIKKSDTFSLPNDIKLPYLFCIETHEKASYIIKVTEINFDGIKIIYRKTIAQEFL
jgi:hypothetical protein